MAEWTGLEPATPGVTGRYSNRLNYHSARKLDKAPIKPDAKSRGLDLSRPLLFGAPKGIGQSIDGANTTTAAFNLSRGAPSASLVSPSQCRQLSA